MAVSDQPVETHRIVGFNQTEMMVDALFIGRGTASPSFTQVVSVESPVYEGKVSTTPRMRRPASHSHSGFDI